MLGNKLTLYCSEYEQAMLWEACRWRDCKRVKKCLYRSLVERFGDQLCTPTPIRITSVADAQAKLEQLNAPMPLTRTPMMSMDAAASPIPRRKARKIEASVKSALPMDLLKEEIAASVK